MIFDAHSDYLTYVLQHPKSSISLIKSLPIDEGAILNYYFKGSESYDHFLFVLAEITKLRPYLSPLYLLGLEGLGPMKSIDDVQRLKKAGIRSVMLTWNDQNQWATGTYQDPDRGLTKAGYELLKCLESEGFYLDLSHANEKTFWEALNHFHGRVFVSHANARAICENERNLTDAQIKAIAERNGVIGLNAYAPFVGGSRNLDALIDHAEYIRDLVGLSHICLGCDFDDYLAEIPSTIHGLSSHRDLPHLWKAFLTRGWCQEDIEAIAHKNIGRFLHL